MIMDVWKSWKFDSVALYMNVSVYVCISKLIYSFPTATGLNSLFSLHKSKPINTHTYIYTKNPNNGLLLGFFLEEEKDYIVKMERRSRWTWRKISHNEVLCLVRIFIIMSELNIQNRRSDHINTRSKLEYLN